MLLFLKLIFVFIIVKDLNMNNGIAWTNVDVSHMYCGLHLVAISYVYIN